MDLEWLENTATKESIDEFKKQLLRFKITGKTLPADDVIKLLVDMGTCPTDTTTGTVCAQCTYYKHNYGCKYADDCSELDTAARQLSGVEDRLDRITILHIKKKYEQHTKN